MDDKPRAVSRDDDFWVDVPMSGSVHYVSGEALAQPPHILVPDGHGGYREHVTESRPKGRLGF